MATLRTSLGTPALQSVSTIARTQFTTCGAGLMITAEPAARAASTPPAAIATGKFQGGVTTTS